MINVGFDFFQSVYRQQFQIKKDGMRMIQECITLKRSVHF